MRHIQLFEDYGLGKNFGAGPALIVAKGDWTGITQTGEAVDFTSPAVVDVKYYTNPTPKQIGQVTYGQEDISSPEDAVTEIMSGDQGGTNLFKYKEDGLAILIDKSEGPQEIERKIQRILDIVNEGGDTGADPVVDVLEDPDAKDLYTPEYLAHCRACLAKDPTSIKYTKKYPLPAGNGIGPKKIMKRRVNFQVF